MVSLAAREPTVAARLVASIMALRDLALQRTSGDSPLDRAAADMAGDSPLDKATADMAGDSPRSRPRRHDWKVT